MAGRVPANEYKFVIRQILGIKRDPRQPSRDDLMQVLVDWAGPWKYEWQTTAALGFTLASPLIADFIASGGKRRSIAQNSALEGEGALLLTHDEEKDEASGDDTQRHAPEPQAREASQFDQEPASRCGDGSNPVQRDGGGSSS